MKYSLVKMHFTTAVHFGDGGLETCRSTLYADTIFSALCVEASCLSDEKLAKFIQSANDGKMCLSDAFPFIDDKLYLPKPLMRIERVESAIESDTVSSSVLKKAAKKLSYINLNQFDDYVRGQADILEMGKYFTQHFGSDSLIGKNSKVIDSVDTVPFSVRVFRFRDESGLYFILGYESDEEYSLIRELVEHVSLRGIGGKTSSGYGKFVFEISEIPSNLLERIEKTSERYMSLTTSIPTEEEMDGVMNDADFLLVRRGGFVSSEKYSDTLRKKRTLYFAASGAVFTSKYQGKLWEVQTSEGKHPIYKYSCPIFIGV